MLRPARRERERRRRNMHGDRGEFPPPRWGCMHMYLPFSCRLAHLSGRRKLNPARPSPSAKVRDIRRRRRPQVQRRRLVRSARRRRRVVPFPLGPPARIRAPSGRVLPVLLHDHARIHPRGGDARLHPRPHHERVRAHPPQHENTEEGQNIQLQRELR